jgi:hypothetical protein
MTNRHLCRLMQSIELVSDSCGQKIRMILFHVGNALLDVCETQT